MAILQVVCTLLVFCDPFSVYIVYIVVVRIMYISLQCRTLVGSYVSGGHCSMVPWVMTPCISVHP